MDPQEMPPGLQNLGILGLMDPFTALNIRNRMQIGGAPAATMGLVNVLWEAYQDAILEKKLQPFFRDADWKPTFDDLVASTGQSKMTVSAFLTALRAHSEENGTIEFLDPSKGAAARAQAKDTAKAIVSAPMKVVREALKPAIATTADLSAVLTKPLGLVAITAAAAAVIYALYQFSPAFKAARRRKRKR